MTNGSEEYKTLRQDSLTGSLTVLLVLTATQKLIGFARAILVYRWLDPIQTGTWGLAQAMLDTALPLVLLSIPGCFGRYIERYRRQGQARQFLWQASLICVAVMGLGLGIVAIFREKFAAIIFGDRQAIWLVLMTALALIPAAIYAFGNELLIALRLSKSSSRGHFVRATLFALLTVLFVFFWRKDVYALIAACGLSYGLAMIPLIGVIARSVCHLPHDDQPLPFISTWTALTPTIVVIWLADFMSNMFLCVDRYMLIHWLPGDRDSVLGLIGNYESSQVIPILVATTTFMVARLLLPYLAKDWERGDKHAVTHHVALSLKWGAIVLTPASLLVASLSTVIFDHWFQGKYGAGHEIVPCMAGVYLWSGLTAILMNLFWCAEKGGWGVAASIVALMCNVLLNAWWIPIFGIAGAAAATLVANGLQLLLLLGLGCRWGLRPSVGTVVAVFLPASFLLPSAISWLAWGGVAAAALWEDRQIIRPVAVRFQIASRGTP